MEKPLSFIEPASDEFYEYVSPLNKNKGAQFLSKIINRGIKG